MDSVLTLLEVEICSICSCWFLVVWSFFRSFVTVLGIFVFAYIRAHRVEVLSLEFTKANFLRKFLLFHLTKNLNHAVIEDRGLS